MAGFATPVERLAILEIRAARGWTLADVAKRFLVTQVTVASWQRRLDSPDGLLALQEPVNKFPDFVRYTVQRLKVLCPTLGKVKIAEILCRAGLHLGTTTVGRILKEQPQPEPTPVRATTPGRTVTAKSPNHVWHIDLTVVPTTHGGFWTAVAAVRAAAMLAILLVGRCRSRSPFAARDGSGTISEAADFRHGPRVSGKDDNERWQHAPILDLRSRDAIRLRWVPGLVRAARN